MAEEFSLDNLYVGPAKTGKILKLQGQINEGYLEGHGAELITIIQGIGKDGVLMVDCSGVDYLGSKGIAYFAQWNTLITNQGGGLYFFGMKPAIKNVLDVMGFSNLLKIFDTLEEAKLALG